MLHLRRIERAAEHACILAARLVRRQDHADGNMAHDAARAARMILVHMREDDIVEPSHAVMRKVRHIDARADVIAAVARAARVDHQGSAVRRHDESRVALSHVDEMHRHLLRTRNLP